jgi:succinate dehydrogenase / fumarate reductase cytochrome b subunit
MTSNNKPLKSVLRWFDPRKRDAGTWAFVLNRITALGLTFYLYLHLIVLRKLAQGPTAFDSFITLAKSPLYIVGELLVIVAVLLHGLNGLRVTLPSFGIAVPYQKQMFYGLVFLVVVGGLVFAIRMFSV